MAITMYGASNRWNQPVGIRLGEQWTPPSGIPNSDWKKARLDLKAAMVEIKMQPVSDALRASAHSTSSATLADFQSRGR
jgi:hypothetical protein